MKLLLFWIFVLLCSICSIVHTLIAPGLSNLFYPIKSYYGSREKEFYTRSAVLNDNIATFLWFQNFNVDAHNNFWIANPIDHTIIYIDSTTGKTVYVAGSKGRKGFQDGDLPNSRFNTPSSLVFFEFNETAATLEENKIVFILNSTSAECLFATYENYTSCQDTGTNPEDIIDPDNIMVVYPPIQNLTQYQSDLNGNLVFVADKGNSCIRMINLTLGSTSTYAGMCTQNGFMDGPLGVNQFDGAESMGIDALGNIFVVDANNNYIRMIDTQGAVHTMLNGACRAAYNIQPEIMNGLNVTSVSCYRNWIKTSGQPSQHIWTPLTPLEECFEQDLLCGGKNRSHPVLYKNESFRGDDEESSSGENANL